ncbi:MAG: beta strand repeat-containing protein, partial [Methylophagaceae bacterium]
MKYTYLLILLLISSIGFSQTKGITYQAVILNPIETELPGVNQTNAPLANTAVCLKFGILDQNSVIEYLETIQTTTDKFGMVNLIIGTGSQIGGYASIFSDVAWDNNAKNLQVHLNAEGDCSSYTEISNQPFTYVPFALNALNENKKLIDGTIFLGDANGDAQEVTISGDVTIDNAGVTAIGADKVTSTKILDGSVTTDKLLDANVTNAKLATGIDANKLANGTVTNAELQYIGTLSSNAQTQIDGLTSTFATNLANTTAAIAAVQADVDANEVASIAGDATNTAAIATVQADVDANETAANTAIAAVQADVDANEVASIAGDATNASNITTNASNITTNTTDIATNASGITTNTTAIALNTAKTGITSSQASAITTNTTDIATNASGINTNTTAIALNTAKTGITSGQASAIERNTEMYGHSGVEGNTSNISTNSSGIATNVSDITTNASNITTNTTDIATITSGITTNASNITTNTTDIASNASGITTNATDITALETLADGKIYLGNSSNVAEEIEMTGDVTIDNTGATTIGTTNRSSRKKGDILYWNGTAWTSIAVGTNGAVLQLISGAPTWVSSPDITGPTITINGSANMNVVVGGSFTDSGATTNEGTLSTSGIVNVNTVGTYILTYSATDTTGNTSKATRIVNVYKSQFNYTGSVQTFTVPAGVTSISVDAYGASSQTLSSYYGGNGPIGKGGRVQANLTVTAGEVLNIYVGGSRSQNGGTGWNGGGLGYYAGGGASDIRTGGTTLTDRVIVAGGGGGKSTNYYSRGGDGGGLTGKNGSGGQQPGSGGTQSNGAALGQGGSAYSSHYTSTTGFYDSGGGGGGYYGGRGGGYRGYAGSAGGGGSSYSHPTLCSSVIHTQGVQISHGQITI